jgi:hypothetical protein
MKPNLLFLIILTFLLGVGVFFSNAEAQMLALSDNALSKVSAKGIDFGINGSNINVYINNNISIQPLNNTSSNSVTGSVPGVTFTVTATPAGSNLSQTSQPSINISGTGGTSFISFNSVNSAINVGVNVIVVMNSNIVNFTPTQSNVQNSYSYVHGYTNFAR